MERCGARPGGIDGQRGQRRLRVAASDRQRKLANGRFQTEAIIAFQPDDRVDELRRRLPVHWMGDGARSMPGFRREAGEEIIGGQWRIVVRPRRIVVRLRLVVHCAPGVRQRRHQQF